MTRQTAQPDYGLTFSFAKLAPGTVLEGTYLGAKEIKANGRTSNVYRFKNDGDDFEVFEVAAFAARMTKIPIGSYCWVKYNGKVKGRNGNDRHDVEVEFDPDAAKGVDGIPA